MGGGFQIDMLVSMPTMSAEVYFTPLAVLEFCRGMAAEEQNGK